MWIVYLNDSKKSSKCKPSIIYPGYHEFGFNKKIDRPRTYGVTMAYYKDQILVCGGNVGTNRDKYSSYKIVANCYSWHPSQKIMKTFAKMSLPRSDGLSFTIDKENFAIFGGTGSNMSLLRSSIDVYSKGEFKLHKESLPAEAAAKLHCIASRSELQQVFLVAVNTSVNKSYVYEIDRMSLTSQSLPSPSTYIRATPACLLYVSPTHNTSLLVSAVNEEGIFFTFLFNLIAQAWSQMQISPKRVMPYAHHFHAVQWRTKILLFAPTEKSVYEIMPEDNKLSVHSTSVENLRLLSPKFLYISRKMADQACELKKKKPKRLSKAKKKLRRTK